MDQSTDPAHPTAAKGDSRSGQPSQDDDGFVDIHHEDVEMQDSGPAAEAPSQRTSSESLDLHPVSHSDHADEEPDEEDFEDDHDIMANHPLLNMLTGRLGQRRRGSAHKWDKLHPENQALSINDVDQCSALEDEAFPVEERASREKVRGSAIAGYDSTCLEISGLTQVPATVSLSPDQMSRAELGPVHSAHQG
jgi:hypothetical protein